MTNPRFFCTCYDMNRNPLEVKCFDNVVDATSYAKGCDSPVVEVSREKTNLDWWMMVIIYGYALGIPLLTIIFGVLMHLGVMTV